MAVLSGAAPADVEERRLATIAFDGKGILVPTYDAR